jgi:hypothetical protein
MNKYQIFSLLGLLGALLMFTGDMFLYYEPVSGPDYNSIAKMSTQPFKYLFVGGILGPIASLFYILGGYLFYLIFKPVNQVLASILFALFAIVYIFAGTYHASFPNYGFIGRLPLEFQSQQIGFIRNYLGVIYNLMFYCAILWTILLFYLVIFKKSVYPKWMLIFTPTLLTMLSPYIKSATPYPYGAIVYGGWLNIVYIIFFTVCLIHFSRRKIKARIA